MGLRAIREGLRVQLATISGLRAHDTWPAQIHPPAAIVRPVSGTYHETFGAGTLGSPAYVFEIVLLLPVGRLESQQETLDGYLAEAGALSIRAAIEADPTLGGAASVALVRGWRDYGLLSIGEDSLPSTRGLELLGAKFDVDVWT